MTCGNVGHYYYNSLVVTSGVYTLSHGVMLATIRTKHSLVVNAGVGAVPLEVAALAEGFAALGAAPLPRVVAARALVRAQVRSAQYVVIALNLENSMVTSRGSG